jgi:hypothetical protein
MASILARRLQPILEWHLRNTQYCSVPVKNILDAVATVRDVIVYAETAMVPYVFSLLTSKMHLTTSPKTTYSRYFAGMD